MWKITLIYFLLLCLVFLSVGLKVEYFLPDFLKTFLTEQNLDSDNFYGQQKIIFVTGILTAGFLALLLNFVMLTAFEISLAVFLPDQFPFISILML